MNNNTIRKANSVEPSESLQQYVATLEKEILQTTTPGDTPAWLLAFSKENYQECVELLDSILASEPDNMLAKLVWIRAHLGARQLPTTALCAPLEEAALSSDSEPQLTAFRKALFLQATFALSASSQSRLSWSMMEKALSISPTLESASISEELHTYAIELLQQEIERAQQKRESTDYINSLQSTKDNLAETLKKISKEVSMQASHATQSESSPAKPPVTSLSAKDIAQNAPSASSQETTPETAQSGKSWLFYSLALIVVISGALSYFITPKLVAHRSTPAIQLALRKPDKLIPPKLEISRNAPLDKKLESVGRRLQELAEDSETNTKTVPNNNNSDEVDSEALNPENAKHLKTPITPQNDELVALGGESQSDENIPSFDSSGISNTTTNSVESIGSNSRGNPIPSAALGSKLKVDTKGRVFGPSSNLDRANPGKQRTALDGSPLRSYEVKQFSPPKLFKTITATRVLSAPSILSTTLAELPENTPIHVSAQMGRWLELRSTGGRVGYIFSQDAVTTK